MSYKPLISVIIPVYKVENLLRRCIESVINQSYENLEIILIDDGSPDNCGLICDEYAEKDKRIAVIHQSNAGQAGARNTGLDIAKGEYIGFVDSDDYIDPYMYEILLKELIESKSDISVCGRNCVVDCQNNEQQLQKSSFTFDSKFIMEGQDALKRFLLSDGIDSAVWDKLFKRDLLENVRFPLGYVSEDIPFVYEALVKAKRIIHCGMPLYNYYIRPGSTSRMSYSTKCHGLYLYPQYVRTEISQSFPALKKESDYYYYKGLLVLVFLYVHSRSKDSVIKDLRKAVRTGFVEIIKNPYLKKTYKLFSVACFLNIEKLAFKLSEKFNLFDISKIV